MFTAIGEYIFLDELSPPGGSNSKGSDRRSILYEAMLTTCWGLSLELRYSLGRNRLMIIETACIEETRAVSTQNGTSSHGSYS